MLYKQIIFVLNGNQPSDKLRGYDIINALPDKYRKMVVVKYVNLKNSYEKDKNFGYKILSTTNSIIIWILEHNETIMNKLKQQNNVIIYDVVDNYLYNKDKILYLLNNNIIDKIIVNNNFMKSEIENFSRFKGTCNVIYHNYDPIYETVKIYNDDKLHFGFMGSIGSLLHTNNFLYHSQLSKEYSIYLLDTDSGAYVEDIKSYNQSRKLFNLKDLQVKFNCHISIRSIYSDVSKYKTSAKIATAAAMDCNILTSNEEVVKDLLGKDYPFIIYDDEISTIRNMFNLIIEDYYDEKILWNKGLEIMKKVKNKLSINENIRNYTDIFDK